MPLRRSRLFTAVLGLLVLWLTLAHSAALAKDIGDWELTLEVLRKQEQTIRNRVEAFKKRHNSEARRLSLDTEPLLREGARLGLWQATAEDPWEIRDILVGFSRLRSDVDLLLQRPEQTLVTLEQDLVLLDTYRERLAETQSTGMPERLHADVAASERAMEELRAMLASLRDTIAAEAQPLQDLVSRVKTSQDRLQASLAPAWKDYYTQTFAAVFSHGYALVVQEDLEDWRMWAGFMADQFKTKRNGGLIVRGVILSSTAALTAIALMVTGIILAERHGFPRPIQSVRIMTPICLVAGFFFVVLASTGPPFLFIVLNSVGELMWTAALVYMTRLHRVESDDPMSPPILWPMWRIFALGLLFEAFRAPESLMGPILTIVFLAKGISFAIKTKHTPKGQHLDRYITGTLAGLLPCLGGLSLFGLPQAAVLGASALFYIALALRFAATTTHFLSRLEKGRDHLSIVTSILRGAGFPFYFLAYLFLFLWLLSTQYGGENVFLEIVATEARFESIGISLQKIVTLVAGYYITRTALAAASASITGLSLRRHTMEPGVRASLLTINTYFWWGCFSIFALSVLGLSLTNLAVVAGGLSVGIGFGLQNLVNNFIGGLILLFGRSVQAGDTIQIGESLGVVKEVNIRNTEVLTLDNATVFVPNAELVSGKIVNWSHKDPSARQDISIGVAYGSDTAKVRRLLLQAAATCPAVLANPAPTVLHWDFGPSALEFRLRVWLSNVPGASAALSVIRGEIDRLFREADIEIAFPQSEVRLRTSPGLEHLLMNYQEEIRKQLVDLSGRMATMENTTRSPQTPTGGPGQDGPHDR